MKKNQIIAVAFFAALVACSSAPSTTSSSACSGGASGHGGTGGSGGRGGAGGHGGEVAPEPDAGGCPSMNGGIVCVTSADCPPMPVECGCFECLDIPDGTRACRWFPPDAGVCGSL